MKKYIVTVAILLSLIGCKIEKKEAFSDLKSYFLQGTYNNNGTLIKTSITQKPNILFIMTDDHAMAAISAYKGFLSEVAPTPNIDRIANDGMRFNNMFCTNSICGPSRASILTGKYAHVNGFFKNEGGGDFNGAQQTFPKLLQKAGYETAVIGKWHLGTAPTGFDYYKVLLIKKDKGLILILLLKWQMTVLLRKKENFLQT